MRLHEAIEKAGEGGKIRRKNMTETINIGDKHHHLILADDSAEPYQPYHIDLTATDWEVVEDEVIEVGDEVRWDDGAHKFTILAAADGIAVLQNPLDLHHIEGMRGSKPILLSDLTLIRKGPKVITLKGMGIVDGNHLYGDDIGSIVEVTGIFALSNNDKTYTITFTEERVEPELDGRN